MPANSWTCAPPRPFRPATPRRIASLAPSTRPDDLVPPMAKPAPAAASVRFRNVRRVSRAMGPPLGGNRLWMRPSGGGITRDYDGRGGPFLWPTARFSGRLDPPDDQVDAGRGEVR